MSVWQIAILLACAVSGHALGEPREINRDATVSERPASDALGTSMTQAATRDAIDAANAMLPGQHADAARRARELIALAAKRGWTVEEGDARRVLGHALLLDEKLNEAETEFHKALALFEHSKNFRGIAESYRGVGLAHAYRDRLDEAILWQKRAADAARRSADRAVLLRALNSLSGAYTDLQRLSDAIVVYDEALPLIDDPRVPPTAASTLLVNFGDTLGKLRQYERALEMFARAEQVLSGVDAPRSFAWVYCDWALTLSAMGRHAEAVRRGTDCIRHMRRLGNARDLADGLDDLAGIELAAGLPAKALRSASEALLHAESAASAEQQRDALRVLAGAQAALSRYRDAYESKERLSRMESALLQAQRKRDEDLAEARYSLERERRQRETLALEQKAQTLELSRRRSQAALAAALAMFAVSLSGSLLWAWQKQRRLTRGLSDANARVSHQQRATAGLNDELSRALANNRVLLQELQHRVKNNLQLILSLINMQIRRLRAQQAATLGEVERSLAETRNRVLAMGRVHQGLSNSAPGAAVRLRPLVEELSSSLRALFDVAARIEVEMAEDLELPAAQALPLALILNELISNAREHAFVASPGYGVITVRMKQAEQSLHCEVEDSGVGFPLQLPADSLGLTIVRDLAAQLSGSLERTSGGIEPDRPIGTRWRLVVPLRSNAFA
jgi:two-component sensor histidine kinase/tetratricopeptide (TPR) repeat protein